MAERIDLDFSIEEDALIQGLLESRGSNVDIVAFGIVYSGTLEVVNVDNGIVVISDGEDKATIEIERIESFSVARQ